MAHQRNNFYYGEFEETKSFVRASETESPRKRLRASVDVDPSNLDRNTFAAKHPGAKFVLCDTRPLDAKPRRLPSRSPPLSTIFDGVPQPKAETQKCLEAALMVSLYDNPSSERLFKSSTEGQRRATAFGLAALVSRISRGAIRLRVGDALEEQDEEPKVPSPGSLTDDRTFMEYSNAGDSGRAVDVVYECSLKDLSSSNTASTHDEVEPFNKRYVSDQPDMVEAFHQENRGPLPGAGDVQLASSLIAMAVRRLCTKGVSSGNAPGCIFTVDQWKPVKVVPLARAVVRYDASSDEHSVEYHALNKHKERLEEAKQFLSYSEFFKNLNKDTVYAGSFLVAKVLTSVDAFVCTQLPIDVNEVMPPSLGMLVHYVCGSIFGQRITTWTKEYLKDALMSGHDDAYSSALEICDKLPWDAEWLKAFRYEDLNRSITALTEEKEGLVKENKELEAKMREVMQENASLTAELATLQAIMKSQEHPAPSDA